MFFPLVSNYCWWQWHIIHAIMKRASRCRKNLRCKVIRHAAQSWSCFISKVLSHTHTLGPNWDTKTYSGSRDQLMTQTTAGGEGLYQSSRHVTWSPHAGQCRQGGWWGGGVSACGQWGGRVFRAQKGRLQGHRHNLLGRLCERGGEMGGEGSVWQEHHGEHVTDEQWCRPKETYCGCTSGLMNLTVMMLFTASSMLTLSATSRRFKACVLECLSDDSAIKRCKRINESSSFFCPEWAHTHTGGPADLCTVSKQTTVHRVISNEIGDGQIHSLPFS